MSKPDSWLPLYVADYLADTTRLTTEQHGAYLLLIMDYWRNGPPPDDDAVLAQITGLSSKRWKAHRAAIQVFFTIHEGIWRQKRIDKEISRAKSVVEQRSEAGRASANKRWGNGRCNENSNEIYNEPITGDVTNASRDDAPSQLTTHNSLSHSPAPSPKGVARAERPPPQEKAKTTDTWLAYANAYRKRYGVDPTPNAKVRSQLSQFIDRVGIVDAPEIAEFYVRHNKAWYVSHQHPVGSLLADAEGLRTQWLNGRVVTDTEARQADRKQSNLSVAEKLIAEERAKHV